jgi:tape measure domain-containing protein
LGFKLDDGPLKKYDKQIASTKEKSNGLATAARGIGTAYKWAAAAVALGVGLISKNIIDATLEMEGYRSQIQAFTGDADSAAEALAALRDKTIDPLFGTGNLVNTYKQLRTVGMSADDTSRMIDVLGDVANGSTENFNALSNVLTRVAATGKFNALQLNQLAQSGFGVQDMAQGLGISVAQLNRDLDAGKIGFNELTRAMAGATAEGGRFYQNAARQALTFGGSIKILKDTISSIGDAIGTKVLPKLAEFISYINNLIKLGRDGLIGFGVKAFDYLIHLIAQVIIFFEVFQMRLRKMGVSFEPLIGIARDVFGFIIRTVRSATPVIQNLGAVILAAFEPIRAFVRPILEALEPIMQRVFGTLAALLESLVPNIRGLTPIFEAMGSAIGKAFEKIIPVIDNVKNAIIAAVIPVRAFLTPIIKSLQPLFENIFGAIGKLFGQTEEDTKGIADAIKSLTPAFSVLGNIVAFFIDIFGTGLGWIIESLGPFIKYILLIVAAIKVWSIAQGILNAVMAINPIIAIIIAVILLIGLVVVVIKNWDKVADFFVWLGHVIADAFMWVVNKIVGFFTWVIGKIKMIWNGIIDFFKKWGEVILQILAVVIFGIPGLIAVAVRQIIKHWDVIGPKVKAIWEEIKNFFIVLGKQIANIFLVLVGKIKQAFQWVVDSAIVIWDTLRSWFIGLVDGIKANWRDFVAFLTVLWEGIKEIAATIWEGIKGIFFGAIDGIKAAWNEFTRFFTGLWEAMKEGPTAALEYIKNAFFGLFEKLYEKFTWFIDVIREGWEKAKGFFGGIGKGVVNFFTGGDPQGNGSGESDGAGPSAVEAGGRPRLATATPGGGSEPARMPPPSLAQSALQRTAAQNTYSSSTISNNPVINSSANINVSVPPGTTAEQAQAISRQVDRAVQESLSNTIGGARGLIPSPEARRY